MRQTAQLKREDSNLDHHLPGLYALESSSSPIIDQDVRSVQSGSGLRGESILVQLLQMAFLELYVDVSSLHIVPSQRSMASFSTVETLPQSTEFLLAPISFTNIVDPLDTNTKDNKGYLLRCFTVSVDEGTIFLTIQRTRKCTPMKVLSFKLRCFLVICTD
jgi:hypothetical protein